MVSVVTLNQQSLNRSLQLSNVPLSDQDKMTSANWCTWEKRRMHARILGGRRGNTFHWQTLVATLPNVRGQIWALALLGRHRNILGMTLMVWRALRQKAPKVNTWAKNSQEKILNWEELHWLLKVQWINTWRKPTWQYIWYLRHCKAGFLKNGCAR